MRKNINKTQLGSVMIEALSMLALIALVTPVLYKKSAERATELQDINAASELRAIVKGVDDYISTNYETIINHGKVINNCAGATEEDYAGFTGTGDDKNGGLINETIEVPLAHFCDYLPYGVLTEKNGKLEPNQSRLFSSEYKVYLKLNGTSDNEIENEAIIKGQKVVTAFVVTKPNQDMKELRANSIASMIGGNGGVATSNKTIEGNMGIWSIADTTDVSAFGAEVTKGAVVAASIEGISAQNSKINLDEVLHRVKQNENPWLNAMETTLYMGLQGATVDKMNDIVNIGHLIIAAEENGGNNETDRLYLDSGNINVANKVTIDDEGNITAEQNISAGGDLTVDGSATIGTTLMAAAEAFKVEDGGSVSAANGTFTVDTSGATSALSYKTNDDKVNININGISSFKEPLEVESTRACSFASDNLSNCALLVKGDLGVTGDITVKGALNTKNLHARETLTVGGDSSSSPKALKVAYTADKSTFEFGNGTLGDNSVISAETGASSKFVVKNAKNINLITADKESKLGMTDAGIGIFTGDSGTTPSAEIQMFKEGQIGIKAAEELDIASNDIFVNPYQSGGAALHIQSDSTRDTIKSNVDAFKITPNKNGDHPYFSVGNMDTNYNDGSETYGNGDSVRINSMPLIMRNGSLKIKDTAEGYFTIVRVGDQPSDDALVDISRGGMTMDSLNNNASSSNYTVTKVLKIDLKENPVNTDNYPIYIRKGAIELTADGVTGGNYVKADRFISNKTLESKALINYSDADATPQDTPYEVNPAYTSVMHDIKLTTRGGARLSDILPDFINKGIYVVDNTYPASGYTCDSGQTGMKLDGYRHLKRSTGKENDPGKIELKSCTSYTDEASAWSGFVPTPTCPPGYVKVITLTPSSFQMAEAGNMESNPATGNLPRDINPQYYPYIVTTGPVITDIKGQARSEILPFYFQKNTWFKSFAAKSFASGSGSSDEGADNDFEGWDVGLGFVYPYKLFKSYLDDLGSTYKAALDSSECNTSQDSDEINKQCIYWNVFPVAVGSLEGYATVYCYFDRRREGAFNSSLVDTTYDQMESFRGVQVKATTGNTDYINRLNSPNSKIQSAW